MPIIAKSGATTRILLPDSIIIAPGTRPAPRLEIPKSHGQNSFGVVYVNALARGPMLSKEQATFPTGSIIVREKLTGSETASPDLLTVMIKRHKGFNRKANDWDFLVVSGDGKRIDKSVKSGECVNCHESRSRDDFVFRQPSP